METNQNIPIKAWSEDDRPREKLIQKGKAALSNSELIAILIGSGNPKETAVDIAKKILDKVNNDINELSKMSLMDLTKFNGIGEAKAITIIAAMELGRRKKPISSLIRKKIQASKDAADLFQPRLADHHTEEFWILLLNRANMVLGEKLISSGGMTGTVADGKEIFRTALEHKTVSIILCHNHPSGNCKPSDADVKLTRRLKQAGESIEIQVLDHIIVSDSGYYSFADEGLM